MLSLNIEPDLEEKAAVVELAGDDVYLAAAQHQAKHLWFQPHRIYHVLHACGIAKTGEQLVQMHNCRS